MAWCPKCNGNYPIVTSVKGESGSMPIVSERYNRYGEYIGYEEGAISDFEIKTLPRCSNCYSVFKFPYATSKEEYFYAERELQIKSLRASKPSEPTPMSIGCAVMCVVVVTLLVGVIAYSINKSPSPAIFIGLLVAVALGLLFRTVKYDDIKKRKNYEDEIKRWERKLNELQAMEYSDEHYEELIKRSNPAQRELTPKELRVLSVFREKRPMEKLHREKRRKSNK